MIGPISWHQSDNGNRNDDGNYDADGDGNDNGGRDDDGNGDIDDGSDNYDRDDDGNYDADGDGNDNGDRDDDGNGDVPSPISPASGQQRVAWACKELLTNALLTNTISALLYINTQAQYRMSLQFTLIAHSLIYLVSSLYLNAVYCILSWTLTGLPHYIPITGRR